MRRGSSRRNTRRLRGLRSVPPGSSGPFSPWFPLSPFFQNPVPGLHDVSGGRKSGWTLIVSPAPPRSCHRHDRRGKGCGCWRRGLGLSLWCWRRGRLVQFLLVRGDVLHGRGHRFLDTRLLFLEGALVGSSVCFCQPRLGILLQPAPSSLCPQEVKSNLEVSVQHLQRVKFFLDKLSGNWLFTLYTRGVVLQDHINIGNLICHASPMQTGMLLLFFRTTPSSG